MSTRETAKDNWADDDSGSEDERAFREKLALPPRPSSRSPEAEDAAVAPSTQEDKPVASLASRISGLSTNPPSCQSTQPTVPPPISSSPGRPKPQTNNALFGRALAGVKSDRAVNSATSPSVSSSAAGEQNAQASTVPTSLGAKQEGKEGAEKDQMNVMHNDIGQGETAPPSNGNGNGNVDERRNGEVQADEAQSETGKSGLISNDFQVEVRLADLQGDPNSPLYSVQEFEQLPIHPLLLKGIYSAGFTRPSKIQEKALPMLLGNPARNLIGQSQSGTGKTAAFTLNMLSRVDPGIMAPQAICLAPSRELARQIQNVVDRLGQFTEVKSFLAVPGSWQRGVKIDKHILIGTPGTIVDMLSRRGTIFDPKLIRVLVLDEADEMVALQGLGDQTTRIKRMLPHNVQIVLFSATFPDEVQRFAQEFAPEANQIFLKKEEVTVDAIKQLYLEVDSEEQKYDVLASLYEILTIGQSIVFCKRRDTADRIAQRLRADNHQVASLHGEKQSHERDEILDGFRDGKTKVLITTNVVARGIDIQQVNMVVNYDVPDLGPEGNWRPDIETYIHRIGRTGRFGRKGVAVIFAHDKRSKDDVNEIMRVLGKPMKRIDAGSKTDIDQLETALKAAVKGPKKGPA